MTTGRSLSIILVVMLLFGAGALAATGLRGKGPAPDFTYTHFRNVVLADRTTLRSRWHGHNEEGRAHACGLIASAATLKEDEQTLRYALDCIRDEAVTDGNRYGWGIGTSFDSGSDGSVNPAGTIYGVTFGYVANGLIDGYETTGDATFLEMAARAADYYAQFLKPGETEGLYAAYSELEVDDQSLANVTGIVALAYARLGKQTGRDDFLAHGKAMGRNVAADMLRSQDGPSWLYVQGVAEEYNDALHGASTAYALARLADVTGEDYVSRDELRAYLLRFLTSDGCPARFADGEAVEGYEGQPAKSWGVGMMIAALSELGLTERAETVRDCIEGYRFRPDMYGLYHGGRQNLFWPNAHLLFGVASLEAAAEKAANLDGADRPESDAT
ncbi:MAG: hypothetical protein AAF311_00885 [Pseudomonadota bacterium]